MASTPPSSAAPTWIADVLDGFEQTTITMPPAEDGLADTVVVRRAGTPTSGPAVLYVHGFGDYFFQTHLAEFYEAHGLRFYAVDLRRHGRALRPHQLPNYTSDVDQYVADIDAAVRLLRDQEGVDWLLLNGHSTGGLAAVLQASRGAEHARVDAVFLNSPFLDMNLPEVQERVLEPLLAAIGKVAPRTKVPGLSSIYGDSIHASRKGEWSFDLAWKPLEGFPARAGWVRAIHRAQAEVARGLHLQQPVLLLHSSRSLRPKQWSEDVRSADIVLDIADMQRLAPALGSRVEVAAVEGGLHDLVLSAAPARARTFELLAAWLGRVRPT